MVNSQSYPHSLMTMKGRKGYWTNYNQVYLGKVFRRTLIGSTQVMVNGQVGTLLSFSQIESFASLVVRRWEIQGGEIHETPCCALVVLGDRTARLPP
jgi:hypothetical protein